MISISGTLSKGNTFKIRRFDASYSEATIYSPTGKVVWRTEPLTAGELGDYFKQWLPLTGKLHPTDGLKGCLFTVKVDSIVLRSPYTGHTIVDMIEGLDPESWFPWLLERLDW